jgi:hypothetical protein
MSSHGVGWENDDLSYVIERQMISTKILTKNNTIMKKEIFFETDVNMENGNVQINVFKELKCIPMSQLLQFEMNGCEFIVDKDIIG